jgi:U5 small nuclear ribonucleoprotein component
MDDLYDEFGNYIGEPEESEEEDQQPAYDGAQYLDDDEAEEAGATGQEMMEVDEEGPSNAVILHEDKQYYPSASQVYGPDVETLVQEEDTQSLQQPIVAPIERKKFTVQEEDLPPVYFDRGFLSDLMSFPEQIRNVVLCGHLHHGKTSFMDMLVAQTHDVSAYQTGKTGKAREACQSNRVPCLYLWRAQAERHISSTSSTHPAMSTLQTRWRLPCGWRMP